MVSEWRRRVIISAGDHFTDESALMGEQRCEVAQVRSKRTAAPSAAAEGMGEVRVDRRGPRTAMELAEQWFDERFTTSAGDDESISPASSMDIDDVGSARLAPPRSVMSATGCQVNPAPSCSNHRASHGDRV
jgi:hypothetical protein